MKRIDEVTYNLWIEKIMFRKKVNAFLDQTTHFSQICSSVIVMVDDIPKRPFVIPWLAARIKEITYVTAYTELIGLALKRSVYWI